MEKFWKHWDRTSTDERTHHLRERHQYVANTVKYLSPSFTDNQDVSGS